MDKYSTVNTVMKPIFRMALETYGSYIRRTLQNTEKYGQSGFWEDPIMQEFHEVTKKVLEEDAVAKSVFANFSEVGFIIIDQDQYYRKSFYLALREWVKVYAKHKKEIDAWVDKEHPTDEYRRK